MIPARSRWFDEEADLQVFVPGLMATGILVSICMFVWDGVKRFLPDVGKRKHAARARMHVGGRVSDLTSIHYGSAPAPVTIARVRRSRTSALLLAFSAFLLGSTVAYITVVAYVTEGTSFSGRGWTLSMGLPLVLTCTGLGVAWACAALYNDDLPEWAARAQSFWPIGVLPDDSERAG